MQPILFYQIRIVLLHLFDFFLILLVLDVFVSVEVIIEIDRLSECDPVAQLHPLEWFVVVVKCESVERNRQDGRPSDQLDAFLRVTQLAARRALILVAALQHLRLDVIFECHLYRGV